MYAGQSDQNEIVIFNPDETIRLEVRMKDETVWLTQAQMSLLFGVQRQAVTKHLKNIFSSGELDEESTCSILEQVQIEGNRKVLRRIEIYNLDVIISVGFRVNTKRGILFRKWANSVLNDYLLRGHLFSQRIKSLEDRVAVTENKIEFFVRTSLPPVEGIFFEGQIFDAYVFVSDLIRRADNKIILIDNYIDESVLTILDKRKKGVLVNIFTDNTSKQLALDICKHNLQYPPFCINHSRRIHDRFLIIDNELYHLGASLKDLGKKLFAFSKMHEDSLSALLEKLPHTFRSVPQGLEIHSD